MKTLLSIALAAGLFAASVSAQTTGRTFDNFDTAAGVNVYSPPAPEPAPKSNSRRRKGSKSGGDANGSLVKKTGSSNPSLRAGEILNANIGRMSLVMGSSRDLKGFTTGSELHDSIIVESSRKYNIDPLLIYSQMHQESSFKIKARSPKGASGLMQLMPATARRFGVTKIYDPKQNIEAGVRYMRWLLDAFNGDVVLALAGYNAGEGAVMKYGGSVPPYRETREYVRRISARYNSISNPQYIASAKLTKKSSAEINQKEKTPLTVWEPTPIAVRTSDGRIMLVNQ